MRNKAPLRHFGLAIKVLSGVAKESYRRYQSRCLDFIDIEVSILSAQM